MSGNILILKNHLRKFLRNSKVIGSFTEQADNVFSFRVRSLQMQQEIIDRIAASLPDPDNVIKNTAQFTRDILMAYEANKQQIQTMFSGSQSSRLPMLVKAKILELIQQLHPEIEDSQRLRLILNYKIYGAYYAFLEDTDMNEMEKIEYISNLAGESSFNA